MHFTRLTLTLSFISLYSLCQAQLTSVNDRVLFAFPVQGIMVDGDLSDWPEGSNSYPIAKRLWGPDPANDQDLSANFQVAYDTKENVLYVGVIVQDDYWVQSDDPSWNNQDGYTFYINEQFHPEGSGIARFTLSQNFKEMTDPDPGWDPLLGDYLDGDKLKYGVQRMDGKTVYELQFKLKNPIYTGRIIGLGHLVYDQDSDRERAWGWQSRGGKSSSAQPGRIGMLIFADPNMQVGEASGMVSWNDPAIPTRVEGVKIFSTSNPSFWMHLPVDRGTSYFKVTLPAGEYVLKPGKTAFFNGNIYLKADTNYTQTFEVKANSKTEIAPYQLIPVQAPQFDSTGSAILELAAEDIRLIDATMRRHMEYYEIEGAALGILKGGELAYQQTYGVENAYSGEPLQKTTLFEVASITKPFVAFATLRLYERGIIDLDAPLYQYQEFDIIAHHPYSKLITARMVLSHQTGLPNWRTNDQLPFVFEPGTGFNYSGEAYQYLGRVLEKLTGKDINTILQEEVAQLLDIDHLYFKTDPYAEKHKSHGHQNGYPDRVSLPDEPWVAGSLVTNVESLAKFLIAIHERKGLKPETYELMFTPQIAIPEDQHENNWGYEEYMGLGFFIEKAPHGMVFKHSGNNGDFKAVARFYDALNMGYITLTNGNTGHFIINAVEKVLLDPGKL